LKKILGILVLLFVGVLCFYSALLSVEEIPNPIVSGTYASDEFLGATFSFEKEINSFHFYSNQLEDSGLYYFTGDTMVLSGKVIRTDAVIIEERRSEFVVQIDGELYRFHRISNAPTVHN